MFGGEPGKLAAAEVTIAAAHALRCASDVSVACSQEIPSVGIRRRVWWSVRTVPPPKLGTKDGHERRSCLGGGGQWYRNYEHHVAFVACGPSFRFLVRDHSLFQLANYVQHVPCFFVSIFAGLNRLISLGTRRYQAKPEHFLHHTASPFGRILLTMWCSPK